MDGQGCGTDVQGPGTLTLNIERRGPGGRAAQAQQGQGYQQEGAHQPSLFVLALVAVPGV